MDFGFNEDQELLRDSARAFLEKECPMTLVRRLMAEEEGHDPALWRQMGTRIRRCEGQMERSHATGQRHLHVLCKMSGKL